MDLTNSFFSGTVPDGLCIDGAIMNADIQNLKILEFCVTMWLREWRCLALLHIRRRLHKRTIFVRFFIYQVTLSSMYCILRLVEIIS